MTKEELLALGLTEDQIAEVFKINGKDVEKAKGDLATVQTELASTKEQLNTANTEIESYKSMDIDGIKASAESYKTKFEAAQANAQKEIDALKFSHAIENALSTAKAKNVKAVKALLNMEGLKLNGEEIVGLKEQIENIRKDNEFLFDEVEPNGTGGSKGGGAKGGKGGGIEENYGASLAKLKGKEKAPETNPYEL